MMCFNRTVQFFAVSAALAFSLATAPGLVGEAWAVDVEGVEIVAGDDTTVLIHLTEGSDGAAVSSFTMGDPDRVIVDIADVRAVDGLSELSGDGGLVEEILISTIEMRPVSSPVLRSS